MFDARLRLSNQVAEEVRRYFGEKVFHTIVQRNVRISEAPSFGKPVILYDASSMGARNYIALAREILQSNKQFLEKDKSETQEVATESDSNNRSSTHPDNSSAAANGFAL